MSLVNNYLKQLGRKSIAPESKGMGVVPPSLQRTQKKSWKSVIGKKYLGFAGLVVLLSCLGYLFISVISILLYPVVDESVAVEPKQIPLENSAKDIEETHVVPHGIVNNGTSERKAETQPENEPKSPIVSREFVVAQNNAVPPPPLQGKDEISAGANPKSIAPVPVGRQSDRFVEDDGNKIDSSVVIEEPRPLAESWNTADDTPTPSSRVKNSPSKIILKESNNTPDYIYQLGLQAQHSNQYGRAERYYRNVLAEVPDHENALVNLSAIYIEEKRMQEAQKLLDQVIDKNPQNSKALVNAGMIELQQNKKEVAANYFLMALKFNPIEETALRNMAYLAQLDKRYDDAGNYFEQLIRISPANSDILLAYAGLEETRKKYTSAIKLYILCLDQISMQKDPQMHEEIMIRIQTLKQYSVEQAY